MSAYNKIDGVMLGRLLDDNNYQAGVYASAYRIYDAANMIGYLFAAILLPMFAAHIHEKNVLEELKNVSLRYVVVSACMIVFSIFCYGNDILVLMYKDFEPSFLLSLKILISGYFMVAVAYIFGTLLVASGKVRNLNILFGAGLVINFLLNAALIPAYMASGAAVATLITQTFVMIGQIFLVKKELDISIRTKEIQLLGSFILASGLVFLVLYYIIPCQWYCKLAISILICLLLCLILKIIDKTEIRNLLMTKK
jgi:O-antigen/teichoic acid export membrane protein